MNKFATGDKIVSVKDIAPNIEVGDIFIVKKVYDDGWVDVIDKNGKQRHRPGQLYDLTEEEANKPLSPVEMDIVRLNPHMWRAGDVLRRKTNNGRYVVAGKEYTVIRMVNRSDIRHLSEDGEENNFSADQYDWVRRPTPAVPESPKTESESKLTKTVAQVKNWGAWA
jgi:hypothetical protein